MKRQTKMRGKLSVEGVDIIDCDGSMLAGLTNRNAVDLGLWLTTRFAKILKRAYQDEGNWPPKRSRK